MLGTSPYLYNCTKSKSVADASARGAYIIHAPSLTQEVQHQAFKDTAESLHMHGYILLVFLAQILELFTDCCNLWSLEMHKLHCKSLKPQVSCFS